MKLPAMLIALVLALLLPGCASHETKTRSERRFAVHTFTFDAHFDSPGIEILAFQYGTASTPGMSSCREPPCNGSPQYAIVGGKIEVAEFLYVKWRVRASGQVFDRKVDLRNRLPQNMEMHTVRFIAYGDQLYVYLISPERAVPNPCTPFEVRRHLPPIPRPEERMFFLHCGSRYRQLYPST